MTGWNPLHNPDGLPPFIPEPEKEAPKTPWTDPYSYWPFPKTHEPAEQE